MKEALLDQIGVFLENNPTLKGKPASENEIASAEEELQVKLHEDYKGFIKKFGGSFAGLAIHAFSNGSSIGKETIVDLTKQSRHIARSNEIFPELEQCYVIAEDGSGNPIAVSTQGEILLFDYDTAEKRELAKSFEELIEANFQRW